MRKTSWPSHHRGLRIALFGIMLSCLIVPGQGTAAEFLRFVEDLPLAPGLVEDQDTITIFDKPNGRIVETSASGAQSTASVVDFYRQTLPQLGWVPIASVAATKITARTIRLRFSRAREALSLVVGKENGVVVVRYAIAPL